MIGSLGPLKCEASKLPEGVQSSGRAASFFGDDMRFRLIVKLVCSTGVVTASPMALTLI